MEMHNEILGFSVFFSSVLTALVVLLRELLEHNQMRSGNGSGLEKSAECDIPF